MLFEIKYYSRSNGDIGVAIYTDHAEAENIVQAVQLFNRKHFKKYGDTSVHERIQSVRRLGDDAIRCLVPEES